MMPHLTNTVTAKWLRVPGWFSHFPLQLMKMKLSNLCSWSQPLEHSIPSFVLPLRKAMLSISVHSWGFCSHPLLWHPTFIIIFRVPLNVSVWMNNLLRVCLCKAHMPGACCSHRRVLDPLALELQAVGNCQESAGNRTQVLCRNKFPQVLLTTEHQPSPWSQQF